MTDAKPLELDMSNDRMRAAAVYATNENVTEVAKETGIAKNTIYSWIHRNDEEFFKHVYRIRDHLDKRLDAKMSQILELSLQKMHESIASDKKHPPREYGSVFATVFDKRQVIRGKPTSIGAKSGKELIKDLKKEFEKEGKEQLKKIKDSENVVEMK